MLYKRKKLSGYINAVILPKSTTREEKQQLEFNLQIKRSTKMDYTWVNEAMMLKDRINKGIPIDVLAKKYHFKKSEIQLFIDALNHGEKYLKRKGLEKEYSNIEKHEQAFKELAKWHKKIDIPEKSDFFREYAFDIISSKEKTEIDYRFIKSMHKNFPSIYNDTEIRKENDSEKRIEIMRDIIKTAEEKNEDKNKKEYPILCLKKAKKYIEETKDSLNKENSNEINHLIKDIENLISDIKKICQD